jgi:hypothetical protein
MARKPALSVEPEYRSGLESRVGKQLTEAGVRFDYEGVKLTFNIPSRPAKYTPDFPCRCPIILETKGFFYNGAADRQRLVLVKEQHPEIDLRIVFQNASKPIYKGSKTSYAKWADDHGFKWADKGRVPDTWIAEIKAFQQKDT